MEKVLAVIGAGVAAVPILEKAREMNIKTIAFGGDDSLAKDMPDLFVSCSIFDIDYIEVTCKKQMVGAVIASSEITTEIVALLAKRLGLPGNKIDGGFIPKNKYLMRESVKQAKIVKQPNYKLYSPGSEITYPIMVKAPDSCGKKGIFLVRNPEELSNAVKEAAKVSTDEQVLLEEYIPGGSEYSVECLANGDHKVIIQITEKITSGAPYFTEIGHHQPASIPLELKARISQATKEILDLTGINCGMAHLEVKIVDNDIYFIEVGARGGDHIADKLTLLSTDYDYYKGAIQCSFGYLERLEANNKAYSGIYYYTLDNAEYKELFKTAQDASWCVENNIKVSEMSAAKGNIEANELGYFIYQADHKIDIHDVRDTRKKFNVENINNLSNIFDLVWDFNQEIDRDLSDEALKQGIIKFINLGYIQAIIDNGKIIALAILYCNNMETKEAYICNVHVLPEYRGNGLANKLVESAIAIVRNNHFETIKLHVDRDNSIAISLYEKYGFKSKAETADNQLEMLKEIEYE